MSWLSDYIWIFFIINSNLTKLKTKLNNKNINKFLILNIKIKFWIKWEIIISSNSECSSDEEIYSFISINQNFKLQRLYLLSNINIDHFNKSDDHDIP